MMEEESLGVEVPREAEAPESGAKIRSGRGRKVVTRRGRGRRVKKTRRGGDCMAKMRGKKSSKKARMAKPEFDESKVDWEWPNTFGGRYCPGNPEGKGTKLWIAIVRSFMDVIAPNLVGRSKTKMEANSDFRFLAVSVLWFA